MKRGFYKVVGVLICIVNFSCMVSIPTLLTAYSLNHFESGAMHLIASATSFLIGLFIAGIIFKYLQILSDKCFSTSSNN